MDGNHRRPRLDQQHQDTYRGLTWVRVACTCGWVSMNHRSRGEARRAWEGHCWLVNRRAPTVYGVDAHRRT